MAGTIPLSMTQQLDLYGKPLKGGQLYIIQAGTVSTPQDAFQDAALTNRMPYPIPLDAAGRVPQFFLADGTVKIRLQDQFGVVQLASDSVLVIGPSAGGGGGGAVDPTQLIQMANIIYRYGFGPLGGYVRLNGLTVGSAISGATERANADCQALFQYLWGIDPDLLVSGGRGASAILDWGANKQIALPDWRGFVPGALDDMGNTPAGRLSAPWFATPLKLGSTGGNQSLALNVTNVPPHQHSGFTGNDTPDHTHSDHTPANGSQKPNGTGTAPYDNLVNTQTGGASTRHYHPFTTDTGAGCAGAAFGLLQPTKLATFYIKL